MQKPKRILALTLALMMFMSVLAMTVSAASYTCPSCSKSDCAPQGAATEQSRTRTAILDCVHGGSGKDYYYDVVYKRNYICRGCGYLWTVYNYSNATINECHGY